MSQINEIVHRVKRCNWDLVVDPYIRINGTDQRIKLTIFIPWQACLLPFARFELRIGREGYLLCCRSVQCDWPLPRPATSEFPGSATLPERGARTYHLGARKSHACLDRVPHPGQCCRRMEWGSSVVEYWARDCENLGTTNFDHSELWLWAWAAHIFHGVDKG